MTKVKHGYTLTNPESQVSFIEFPNLWVGQNPEDCLALCSLMLAVDGILGESQTPPVMGKETFESKHIYLLVDLVYPFTSNMSGVILQ